MSGGVGLTVPLLDGISVWGLLVALFLPWLAGAAIVGCLLPGVRLSIVFGHGYLVGQVAVIVLLLGWDASGRALAFAPPALALSALTVLLACWWRFRAAPTRMPWPDRGAWRHLLWLLPLAWFLFERGSVMLGELSLRPLYAWDAWMNWVPKARVWFDHATLTPFVSPSDWLQASAGSDVRTLGNWRASEYPPGVPLLLLWTMLGAGTWDHTLVYLPWLLLPAGLALALWGHLRSHALSPWLAAVAVYALLSQPLLDTHAVLAGYADLWLAAAFCLGSMALAEWQRVRVLRYAILAMVMALACVLFKTPGLAFAAILIGAAGVLAWYPPVRILRWAGVAAVGCLAIGLAIGMWPGFQGSSETVAALELPGVLPSLELRPAPLLPYLWESLFAQANWHLLWPLVVAALAVGLTTRGWAALDGVAPNLFLAGLGFLLFVFGFTHYFNQAENGVTFNRALLYLAPLAVFVAFEQMVPFFVHEGELREARR